MMTLLTMLLTPLIGAIRLRGKSVLAAAVAHGSFNASAGFGVMLLKGGNDLLVGATGLAGLITLLAANGVLWLVLRKAGPLDSETAPPFPAAAGPAGS